MRHFPLIQIGLTAFLALAGMPLHAEVFPGEKAFDPVQKAEPSDAEQRATREGTASRAGFGKEGTPGPACESGEAKVKLLMMMAGADALQPDQADPSAGPGASKAAQKGPADVPDHDIVPAYAACAGAEADTIARQAASTASRRKNPLIVQTALSAEHAEVKPRGKPKDAAKRKPAEQAEAASREAALAHPGGFCALTTGKVSRTRLQPPVHGIIVKSWGEATDAGPATGVSYQVLSGARVIAPCGGRVVFANSFRSYGQLLIVDCGGGYHMVISGLEKLDVQSGQTIGAGEAVGIMPMSGPGSATRRQVLYIELRHNGRPVNPTLWLQNG